MSNILYLIIMKILSIMLFSYSSGPTTRSASSRFLSCSIKYGWTTTMRILMPSITTVAFRYYPSIPSIQQRQIGRLQYYLSRRDHSRSFAAESEPSSSKEVTLSSNSSIVYHENYFMNQIEETVNKVLSKYNHVNDITEVPPNNIRQTYQIASYLNHRISNLRRNNDCPRCYMQRKHCICSKCVPISEMNVSTLSLLIHRIFIIVHHKEIGLKVDTAKLIWNTFPTKCHLIVGGIDGPEYQDSMKELLDCIQANDDSSNNSSTASLIPLLLFPDDDAKTIDEIVKQQQLVIEKYANKPTATTDEEKHVSKQQDQQQQHKKYDLIVLDGTWTQARKFALSLNKTGMIQRVKLSDEAIQILSMNGHEEDDNTSLAGYQLRRHCTTWRQIGTFEAFRLFLRDLSMIIENENEQTDDGTIRPIWKQIESYQQIANNAARRELGPSRQSKKRNSYT